MENKQNNSHLCLNCDACWLCSSSMFADYTTESQLKIINCIQSVKIQRGDYLIKDGEESLGVYCIKKGSVKLFQRMNKNSEFVLMISGRKEIIGLNSFLNKEVFRFSAVALNEVEACFIPSVLLKNFMDNDQHIHEVIVKQICKNLDSIDKRIVSLSKRNIRERCAELLVYMVNKNESDNKLNFSMSDLASLVGTRKNYLYKIISEFTKKRILTFQNQKIVVTNFDALSQIAMGNDKV